MLRVPRALGMERRAAAFTAAVVVVEEVVVVVAVEVAGARGVGLHLKGDWLQAGLMGLPQHSRTQRRAEMGTMVGEEDGGRGRERGRERRPAAKVSVRGGQTSGARAKDLETVHACSRAGGLERT